MPESVVMIRLSCQFRPCRHTFDLPDDVFDAPDFAERSCCPQCGGNRVTLADIQPRPALWWSETYGLITQQARRHGLDSRHLTWHEAGIGVRILAQLPTDAIALAPIPARHDAERIVRDEYSMVFENSHRTRGDHDRAIRHAVSVLYGAAPPLEHGPLQQWTVRHPDVDPVAHCSLASAEFTLSQLPGGKILTRTRKSASDPWPDWPTTEGES
jgi:hypothetical protein